jgi:hypothetical protein
LNAAIAAGAPASSSGSPKPARRPPPARSSSSPAQLARTAFGGAKGRTDVPKIVDWYMDGKIAIDPMITHTLRLGDINKGFDLMHGRKHPRRRRLLKGESDVQSHHGGT